MIKRNAINGKLSDDLDKNDTTKMFYVEQGK